MAKTKYRCQDCSFYVDVDGDHVATMISVANHLDDEPTHEIAQRTAGDTA